MTVEFVKSQKPNRIGIKSPYNAEFVKELKTKVPSSEWNGSAWFFDEIAKDDVEQLVNKYWPSEDTFQTIRITWSLNRDYPQIDGTDLAYVSRDSWKWRSDFPLSYRIIDADIKSGGSRKNPGLFGKLVIEIACRPDAEFSPAPDEVEVIEAGKKSLDITLSGDALEMLQRVKNKPGNILSDEEIIAAALYEMHFS